MKVKKATGGAGANTNDEDIGDQTGGAGDDADEVTTVTRGKKSAKADDDDMVPRSQLDRVLADMHTFKSEKKKLADALAAKERAELEAQDKWKELYEAEKARADKADETSTQLKDSFLNEKKFSALKTAAVTAGLRAEALDDLDALDLSDIVVETTSTGRTNVMGIEAKLQKIKTAKPHWFGGKSAPKINGKTPITVDDGGDGKTEITIDQIRKAEKAAKKSGDKTEYYDLMEQYRAARGRRLNVSAGGR